MLWNVILGLLILVSPFIFVGLFSKIRDGIIWILILSALEHIGIALITQFFQLFVYSTVLVIHGVILVILAIIFRDYLKNIFSNRGTFFRNWVAVTDWVLVGVAVISAMYLFQANYNYTGFVSSTLEPGYRWVSNERYIYPYYVDEWYALAFINNSIETGQLPVRYPFTNTGEPFPNFEAVFHSFLAEIFLLLALDPLRHYTLLSIVVSTIVCMLIYLTLRRGNATPISASLAALSALYITNSANLPGLWTLIPVVLGSVFFLTTVYGMFVRSIKMVLLASTATLLIYPPLVVLLLPGTLLWLFSGRDKTRGQLTKLLSWFSLTYLGVGTIIASFFFIAMGVEASIAGNSFVRSLAAAFIYPSFTPKSIPEYLPTNIVPAASIFLALVGSMIVVWRRLWWLLGVGMIGILYWIVYANITWRFLIDYQRIVFITSLIIVLLSGFAIDLIWRWLLTGLDVFEKRRAVVGAKAGILIIFLFLLPSYTGRVVWQNLQLTNITTANVFKPAAPANRYLQPDDLRLFRDLHNERFLSPPWKGTVLGVATDNHPLSVKGGTITIEPNLYNRFMQATCSRKKSLAEEKTIGYVYAETFNCPGFFATGTSAEKLTLYKVELN